MKTLRQAKVGDTVTVVKLHGEGAVKRRIMDMGITRGRSAGGSRGGYGAGLRVVFAQIGRRHDRGRITGVEGRVLFTHGLVEANIY